MNENKIVICKGNVDLPTRFWSWAVCETEEFTDALKQEGWIQSTNTNFLSQKQLNFLNEVAEIYIERGDTVKFGEKWCDANGRKDLLNSSVKLTPQWFEDDNGLYTHDIESPGIFDEEVQEAESIYHLFGNDFEYFMDCELIKGTKEDIQEYEKLVQEQNEIEANQWEEFVCVNVVTKNNEE